VTVPILHLYRRGRGDVHHAALTSFPGQPGPLRTVLDIGARVSQRLRS
jgi:hypothetical protein